jgi:quercetin dioxygenase-like cupin family protein
MHQSGEATVLALATLLAQAEQTGPIWSMTSEQLNINLLRFTAGETISEHVNSEVDVLGVVIEGEGVVTVGTTDSVVQAGSLFVIPRGTWRAIRSTSAVFAYLSCHRRRAGLQPTVKGEQA